jgi:hypothetical protein
VKKPLKISLIFTPFFAIENKNIYNRFLPQKICFLFLAAKNPPKKYFIILAVFWLLKIIKFHTKNGITNSKNC